jgi:ankyrin repeat protein
VLNTRIPNGSITAAAMPATLRRVTCGLALGLALVLLPGCQNAAVPAAGSPAPESNPETTTGDEGSPPLSIEDPQPAVVTGCDWRTIDADQAADCIAEVPVDSADEHGWTALHYAAAYNPHVEVVTRLLEAPGVRVNARNRDGRTPLHVAAAKRQEPEFFVVLVDAGADINAQDSLGAWTALHIAARFASEPAVVDVLRSASGVDVNKRGGAGWTPLHVAAQWNAVPGVITALLDRGTAGGSTNDGADIDARNDLHHTPLHIAAQFNTNPLVIEELLMAAGAQVDVTAPGGKTPLHVAARFQSEPGVVAALLDAGADPNLIFTHDGRTWTALALAALNTEPAQDEIIDLLMSNGAR